MVKTDSERVKTQIYVALQIASVLTTLCEPFLPFTARKLSRILVIPTKEESHFNWKLVSETSELLKSGHKIGQAEILFSQIEDAEIQKQIDKLEATKKANVMENQVTEPQKPTATFEDFSKLDLRVGTIIEAEKMPKANKLLVLKVDTGIDVRTIVSGIAEHFSPEEVIGKRVTVLVNLAPRALRGVESQGMILMTNTAEGKLVFVNPETSSSLSTSSDGVENGALIS
jgi:methionyl-tRNA synthetase